jgi:alginate O-acetyltransferase complex protein AlgI
MKTFEDWLNLALWLAGFGHFCILGASVQVPHRLGWKKDLAQLTPFNRKLFWVYSIYTFITIVAFGSLTLVLHAELLRGDRAALGLAAFIAVFWTGRILIDFFYFEDADWPPGRAFVVGHFALTALFLALAATYWTALAWHLWAK